MSITLAAPSLPLRTGYVRLVASQFSWGGNHGLMDRALDLKPEVTQGCGFESQLWQEVSTTEVRPLNKASNPQLLPGRRNVGCPLLLKCREHISLLIILCIIVYVTNKAHLSLICICISPRRTLLKFLPHPRQSGVAEHQMPGPVLMCCPRSALVLG